jgi:hypothetical protein
MIRKVYVHTCSTIDRLVKFCGIDSLIREKVWSVMKYIFSVEPFLIKDLFLDSVIIYVLFYSSVLYKLDENVQLYTVINK